MDIREDSDLLFIAVPSGESLGALAQLLPVGRRAELSYILESISDVIARGAMLRVASGEPRGLIRTSSCSDKLLVKSSPGETCIAPH